MELLARGPQRLLVDGPSVKIEVEWNPAIRLCQFGDKVPFCHSWCILGARMSVSQKFCLVNCHIQEDVELMLHTTLIGPNAFSKVSKKQEVSLTPQTASHDVFWQVCCSGMAELHLPAFSYL